jgi:hypothetical protein
MTEKKKKVKMMKEGKMKHNQEMKNQRKKKTNILTMSWTWKNQNERFHHCFLGFDLM